MSIEKLTIDAIALLKNLIETPSFSSEENETALLIEDFDKTSLEEQLVQLGFIPTVYSPHFSLVNPSLIQQCVNKKMQIIPWTVNDLPTIQRLKAMGVNGIISDYPNLFNQ